jgi:hypothetical protein
MSDILTVDTIASECYDDPSRFARDPKRTNPIKLSATSSESANDAGLVGAGSMVVAVSGATMLGSEGLEP